MGGLIMLKHKKNLLLIIIALIIVLISGSLWIYCKTTLERQNNEIIALQTEHSLNETAYQKLGEENKQLNFNLTGEKKTSKSHKAENLADYSKTENNPLKKIQLQAGFINYLKSLIATQKKDINCQNQNRSLPSFTS